MLNAQEQESLNLIEAFIQSQAPTFPVTPMKKISAHSFNNLFVKDESKNPTGTHKDRMAREIVNTYRTILLEKQQGHHTKALPIFSIISSGSAAFAIQSQLKQFNLPALHILVDINTPVHIIDMLTAIGGRVYKHAFSDKILTGEDILHLTENQNGFDITSNHAFDNGIRFYDRLSYEVINESPDIVFVPYGTGQLFENLIHINKKIITQDAVDPVSISSAIDAKKICFYGSTTNNNHSLATKLYAPFRPFTIASSQRIALQTLKGYCSPGSGIYEFNESLLGEAMDICKQNNIDAEPSGVAGIALFLEFMTNLDPNKKIVIINTGKSICS